MPRRDARSAGAEVFAHAERLSDDLLAVEESAFRALSATWAEHVPDLDRAAARLPSSVLVGVDDLRAAVGRTWEALTDQAAPIARGLLDEACALALASISQELAAIESTFSVRDRGLAEPAASVAGDAVEGLVAAAVEAWDRAMLVVLGQLLDDVEEQVRMAALSKEDPAQVAPRLTSESPIQRQGNAGRGVWWRAWSSACASLRAISIDLTNSVRTRAIQAMNPEAG